MQFLTELFKFRNLHEWAKLSGLLRETSLGLPTAKKLELDLEYPRAASLNSGMLSGSET